MSNWEVYSGADSRTQNGAMAGVTSVHGLGEPHAASRAAQIKPTPGALGGAGQHTAALLNGRSLPRPGRGAERAGVLPSLRDAPRLRVDGGVTAAGAAPPESKDGAPATATPLPPIQVGGFATMSSTSEGPGNGEGAAFTTVQLSVADRWTNVRKVARTAGAAKAAVEGNERAKVLGTKIVLNTEQLEAMNIQEVQARHPRCMLMPQSTARRAWDLLVVALLLWTATVVPLRIAFDDGDPAERGPFVLVEVIVDCFFMLDIAVNFNSSYQVGTKIVISRSRIAKNYLRGWFVFDLVGSIPVSLLDDGTGLYLRNFKLLRLPRLFKLLKLLRLVKMIKLFRMRLYLRQLDKLFHINPGALRMAKFCFWFLVFSHWCACLWLFSSALHDHDPMTWVARHGFRDEDNQSLYLIAQYWALATLTTMGYGDITPFTTAERVFTVFCMVVGVTFYAYITASMSTFLDNVDAASKRYRDKMESIETFMGAKRLSRGLRSAIRDHFELMWEKKTTGYDEDAIMNEMSLSIQANVMQELYADVIPRMKFFDGKDPAFVARVLRRCLPHQYLPDKIICKEGNTGQELHLLASGRVDFVLPNAEVVMQLPAGSVFGEIALLCTSRHVVTVTAASFCEVFSIHRAELDLVLADYPDVEAELSAIAVQRLRVIRDRRTTIRRQSQLAGVRRSSLHSHVTRRILGSLQDQASVDTGGEAPDTPSSPKSCSGNGAAMSGVPPMRTGGFGLFQRRGQRWFFQGGQAGSAATPVSHGSTVSALDLASSTRGVGSTRGVDGSSHIFVPRLASNGHLAEPLRTADTNERISHALRGTDRQRRPGSIRCTAPRTEASGSAAVRSPPASEPHRSSVESGTSGAPRVFASSTDATVGAPHPDPDERTDDGRQHGDSNKRELGELKELVRLMATSMVEAQHSTEAALADLHEQHIAILSLISQPSALNDGGIPSMDTTDNEINTFLQLHESRHPTSSRLRDTAGTDDEHAGSMREAALRHPFGAEIRE